MAKDGQGIAGDGDLPPLSVLLFGSEISKERAHGGRERARFERVHRHVHRDDEKEDGRLHRGERRHRVGERAAIRERQEQEGRARASSQAVALPLSGNPPSHLTLRGGTRPRERPDREVLPLLMPRFLANMAQSQTCSSTPSSWCAPCGTESRSARRRHAELGEERAERADGGGARTCRNPFGSCVIIGDREGARPSPDGSTAVNDQWMLSITCRTFRRSAGGALAMNASTSSELNFSDPSAEMPSDSRSLPSRVGAAFAAVVQISGDGPRGSSAPDAQHGRIILQKFANRLSHLLRRQPSGHLQTKKTCHVFQVCALFSKKNTFGLNGKCEP